MVIPSDHQVRETYQEIVTDQLNQGIIEKAPEAATGERVFYLPHKPVCLENASIIKTRLVFDCSARLSPTSNSIYECMYTALQPNLWDIMVRARMASNLLTGDLHVQKAFLQIGLKT